MQTFISVGSTLLGAFLGRKAISSSTISKATTAARGVGRSIQEGSEAATAEQSAEAIRQQIAEIETEIEAESAALAATEPRYRDRRSEAAPQRSVRAFDRARVGSSKRNSQAGAEARRSLQAWQ